MQSIEDMADWISSVIDSVGYKEASLVGHSQGCLVTIECTARYPDKIKTLSLMGGAGILTLIYGAQIYLASMHQLSSIFLVSSCIYFFYLNTKLS